MVSKVKVSQTVKSSSRSDTRQIEIMDSQKGSKAEGQTWQFKFKAAHEKLTKVKHMVNQVEGQIQQVVFNHGQTCSKASLRIV